MAKFVIYSKDNPDLVVTTVDSNYNPQLTTNEDYAMEFETQSSIDAMIILLPGGESFWGSRRKRPR